MLSENAFAVILVLDIVVVSCGLFFTIDRGAVWILAIDGVAGAISLATVIFSDLTGKWFWIPVVWFMGILIPIVLVFISLIIIAWMSWEEQKWLERELGH